MNKKNKHKSWTTLENKIAAGNHDFHVELLHSDENLEDEHFEKIVALLNTNDIFYERVVLELLLDDRLPTDCLYKLAGLLTKTIDLIVRHKNCTKDVLEYLKDEGYIAEVQ
jgi:hypothetical protein